MSYLFQFKIILVGDSGVGKSSILYRYVNNKFRDITDITIGVDFGVKIITINDVPIKLHIWDTAGQEQFKCITRQYFKNAIGVLLCYDVTNRQSFDNIINWLNILKEEIPNAVIKLIGTKADLINQRTVSISEGKILQKQYNLLFEELSSKDNNSTIDKSFYELTKIIYDKINNKEIIIDNRGVKMGFYIDKNDIIDTSLNKNKNRCC